MSQTMKDCKACGGEFEPKVAKVGTQYCSADCVYDHTGKNVGQCNWCGDDFDIKFTKTFVGCCDICDDLLGMKVLQRLSRRFSQEHDSYALILVSKKILELCGPLCDTPENAKKSFEYHEAKEIA